MRDLAEAGYELIIFGLFDAGKAVYKVAEEYPDTHFVVLDGDGTSSDNVTTSHFRREGGAYLMGMAAALQSETGQIGFIGGAQVDTTEIAQSGIYRQGLAQLILTSTWMPCTSVLTTTLARLTSTSSWPGTTADGMYRSGVDVIHHSASIAGTALPAVAEC